VSFSHVGRPLWLTAFPRRGTAADGWATSSLPTKVESSTSQRRTSRKDSAAVADEPTGAISNLAAKTARQETGDLESIFFGAWPRIDEFEERVAEEYEAFDHDIPRAVPMADVAAMLSTTPNMHPPREGVIAESSSSAVDAHFGVAWDEFTGRGAESASGHILPAFEDEGWRNDSMALVDAVDAPTSPAAPEADGQSFPWHYVTTNSPLDIHEALLPVPVQLARKVYGSIKPRLDRIAEEGLPSWPHNPLLDPVSEHAEGIAESRPEVTKRRMTRSSLVRPEQPLETLQASPPLTPDSPEVEPQAPSVQKTRSDREKKTGRKASIIPPQLDPATPSSRSRAPGVALKAPQPPKVSGVAKKASRRVLAGHIPSVTPIPEAEPASPRASATSGTPQLPAGKRATAKARRTKAPQTHSNGTVGSGVAGPSTSASADQPLYPPALAQRIWDLAEAGKYNAALGLFNPQERFRQIT
jgi:hypothetical protein